jgi:serine/threonine protein kinase
VSDDLTDLFDEAMSATQQPAENPITLELSQARQRYHGASRLAQGGLKRIETVEDRDTGRTLAIARPRHDSPDAREAFLREARITANLTHPNIIPVYDIGIDQHDQPYFTMKLIDGDNLADSLRNRTSPSATAGINSLATRIDHFLKVCDAIAYAHSRGVIHLDLKPENIQLGRFGEVLVCDWGLSKIQDEACEDPHLERYSFDAHERRNLTLGGSIKGTPGYMAPEQCGAFNSRKDHRTDVFSLGCILYELAALRRPIATNDVPSAVRNTQRGKFRPIPDKVPPGLAAVIGKALQYRPENRYQSVDALIRDLSAWRNGFATSAEAAGLARQLSLFYRRHRLACLLSGSFIAILTITVGAFVLRLQRSESAARAALAQAEWEHEQRQLLGNQASPLLIERARTAFRRGRFDETQNLLDGLFSIAPDNSEINNLQTDLHFARGQMARANNYLEPMSPFQKSLTQWLRTRANSPETPLTHMEITDLIAIIDERQPPAGMGFLLAWLDHDDPVLRHTVEAAIGGWSLPEDSITLLELAPELAPPVANGVVRRMLLDRDRLPPGSIEANLPALLAMNLPEDTRNLLVAGPRINLALASRITATQTNVDPEILIDGDLGPASRWRTQKRPAEITIDARAPTFID